MTIRDKHMYTSRQRASVIPVGRVFSLGPLADDGNHPEREGCPLTGGGSVRRADAALWGGGGGQGGGQKPTELVHLGTPLPSGHEDPVLGSKTTTKGRPFCKCPDGPQGGRS